jgi:hypothetical protein
MGAEPKPFQKQARIPQLHFGNFSPPHLTSRNKKGLKVKKEQTLHHPGTRCKSVAVPPL